MEKKVSTPEIPTITDSENEIKDIFPYSDTDKKNKEENNNNINYKNLLSSEITNVEILNSEQKHFDLTFKTILVGNSGVGKSCLSLKATQGIFREDFTSTLGSEFFTFNLKINDTIIKLQIWDTCGQEIYRSLISGFYRNSSLAIIVYSVTDEQSFNDVDKWLKHVKLNNSPEIKIFLIGNKTDNIEERKVSSEQGIKCKEENGFDCFMETSAKTGFNSKELFINGAISLFLENKKYAEMENKENNGNGIKIKDNENLKVGDDEGCIC